jgi:RimJ/RimL family protein N-acetyltransferase
MAVVSDKKINLKDGRCCLLKAAGAGEARGTLNLTKAAALTSEYLILLPFEITETAWKMRGRIKRAMLVPTSLELVAEAAGEIIGYVTASTSPRQRLAHSLDFGIIISKDWRNNGLGRHMLTYMIEWARTVRQLERIELHVHSENKAAIALYSSLGFELEGRRLKAIKYEDGRYMDDLIMGLHIGHNARLDLQLANKKEIR